MAHIHVPYHLELVRKPIENPLKNPQNFPEFTTFPTSDGSSGQFISTNGLGILSFATAGATLNYSDIADATTTVATSTTSVINTFAHASYRSAKYFKFQNHFSP